MTRSQLALLLCCLPLLGMGWFGGSNPLDLKSVVQWPAQAAVWQAEMRLSAANPWVPFAHADKLKPNDCIAFERGLSLSWRACHIGPNCTDAVPATSLPAPCGAIYDLSGDPYTQDQVDDWNEQYAGG